MLKIIIFIFITLSLQHNENSCVYYDDNEETIRMIQDGFNNYTTQNINTESFEVVDNSMLPNCTSYTGFNESTHIHFSIKNPSTFANLTLKTSSTQQWIYFLNHYNDSLCQHPPTTTISLFCSFYDAASPLINSTINMIYPHINNKTLDDSEYFLPKLQIFNQINYFKGWNNSGANISNVSTHN
jgi:hypothetical protein